MIALILFTSNAIAFYLIFKTLIFKESPVLTLIIISLILGLMQNYFGVYQACADGWISPSIGKRGACSHHGGVELFLNSYGQASLIIAILVSIVLVIKLFNSLKNEN